MINKIRVLIKEPGKPCQIVQIKHSIKTFQSIVGGTIKVVPFAENGLMIMNRHRAGLKPNIKAGTTSIRGTLILAAKDGDSLVLYQNIAGFTHTQIAGMVKNSRGEWFDDETKKEYGQGGNEPSNTESEAGATQDDLEKCYNEGIEKAADESD